jgi:hypothetical protein
LKDKNNCVNIYYILKLEKRRNEDKMKNCFFAADIMLPNFEKISGTGWAVIACDQHTSEPEYWKEAEKIICGNPSTLELILPEVYLEETEKRVPKINAKMEEYKSSVLKEYKNSMILLDRTLADGSSRKGIIGCIDLECYDYKKGAKSLVRATEGTVLERIPPRVAVGRGASIELPHVMVLIDDPEKTVIEPIFERKSELDLAYDFDLMLGGGHVKGVWIDDEGKRAIDNALCRLSSEDEMKKKYGESYAPLLFAVGDGNHSLASAKAAYEEVKAAIGTVAAANHPARYALVEIVNLHDSALEFEPIYRVMFGVDSEDVINKLKAYSENLSGSGDTQKVDYIAKNKSGSIEFKNPTQQLTVGTLQAFIDEYIKEHKGVSVDYIHGEEATRVLACKENAIGFIFSGMEKEQLFKTVICDGALPRKTFSMGHAADKRYYLECRKIK